MNRVQKNNKNMAGQIIPAFCLGSAISALLVSSALAIEPVSDADLSEITGQDGVTIIVNGQVRDPGTLQINPDAGTAGVSATLQYAGASATEPLIGAIGNNGVNTVTLGGKVGFTSTIDLDAGVNAAGTTPGVSLGVQSSWNRMRLQVGNMLAYAGDAGSATPTIGYGALALDGAGTASYLQQAGALLGNPINIAANKLHLTIGGKQFDPAATVLANNPYGQFYYRQGVAGTGAELVLDKFYFDVGFTPGTGGMIGACGKSTTCDPLTYGGFTAGRSGLYIGTPHLDFNMTYAINLRAQPLGGATGGFRTDQADSLGMAYWGWTGGFNNAELLLSSGGLWTPSAVAGTKYNPDNPEDTAAGYTAATRSQGLNISFHADFDNLFTWVVGQAGARAVIGFGDWASLTNATGVNKVWGLNAPNIAIDVVNAGSLAPGGLCWGGKAYGNQSLCQGTIGATGPSTAWANGALAPGLAVTATKPGTFMSLPPTATGIALAVRDLSLQAYSRNVTIYDDMNNNGLYTDTVGGVAETKTYQWALIYTLGQIDANIFYYPGDTAGTANGVTSDVVFMSQSFYPNGYDNNNVLLGNTNLMIRDSAKTLGIGFVQSNLLFAAKKFNIALIAGATGPAGTGGIQLSSNDVRFEFQGLLAGGPSPVLTQASFEKMFYMDMNLEMSKFVALLYPDSSNGYPFLGFSARMTFGDTTVAPTNSSIGVPAAADGTYMSLGEPSNPKTDFRIANITGDVNMTAGRVFLISANDSVNAPDKIRRLQIAETIQIGTAVSGGAALTGQVKFGGQPLGAITIPSGQIYSSFTLKPQL
ncbi:MAG: hypothetical protein PSX71_13470 [bacterium]|nr:hypothetical protein [bacterium]